MDIDLKGCTRIVFKFKRFVIKIPNFLYEHDHFLKGCAANWSERGYYKVHSKVIYEGNMSEYVAPSYFCSWFGLIQVQAYCNPKLTNLTEEEKGFYKPLCGTDNKKENFGYYKGKLVCVDYAE